MSNGVRVYRFDLWVLIGSHCLNIDGSIMLCVRRYCEKVLSVDHCFNKFVHKCSYPQYSPRGSRLIMNSIDKDIVMKVRSKVSLFISSYPNYYSKSNIMRIIYLHVHNNIV